MTSFRRTEVYLSREELAAAIEISPRRLGQFIEQGLAEPCEGGPAEFTAATALRLRRMLRLRHDLGVNLCGAAIIVDLLERLDAMEHEIASLREHATR